MAKEQKRSSKEARKPKADPKKKTASASVSSLTADQGSRGRLPKAKS